VISRVLVIVLAFIVAAVQASRGAWIESAGLVAYAANLSDFIGRSAIYVDKILKGEDPAGLAVEQPKKFDLVINLRTAKTLGLTIPPAVLQRADEIIQ